MYLFNEINQITGIIFVSLLIIFTLFLIKRSREENKKLSEQEKEEYEKARKTPLFQSILYIIVGIVLLIYGSEFLVNGVKSIAVLFNWDDRIVSVSLVAIGTSLPELATSLVAAFRKESNLAIGNLIGSNIFNVLAVLGITSIITPIKMIDESLLTDYLWMMISVIILGLFIYLCFLKKTSFKNRRVSSFRILYFFHVLFVLIIFNNLLINHYITPLPIF